jgi:hypothetical protein
MTITTLSILALDKNLPEEEFKKSICLEVHNLPFQFLNNKRPLCWLVSILSMLEDRSIIEHVI